jgi:hypothetical protein
MPKVISGMNSPDNEREANMKTGNPRPLGWFSSGNDCLQSR